MKRLAPLALACACRPQTPQIKNPVPPIVYISTDGSGNYTCDGDKDQIEINAALDYVAEHSDYTTVYLQGDSTYWVDDTLFISADTILEGDASAAVKLVDHAKWWRRFKPLIGQKGMEYTYGLQDEQVSTGGITIRGFELDGNRDNQREPSGNLYYTLIQLQNCYGISIHDMYLHDNLADAIQVSYYSESAVDIDSQFYNNRIHNTGHDGMILDTVGDFLVYDNIITNSRTNSGVRVVDGNRFEIFGNIIGNDPDRRVSGSAAIQLQSRTDAPLDEAEVHHNYLFGHQNWHGIWMDHNHDQGLTDTHRDVYIHHNVISWFTMSGIGIYGFDSTRIEHNVIELSMEGAGVTFYQGMPQGAAFQTEVRNNILLNNTGFGIDNQASDVHSFVSEYNCIYGNGQGPYQGAASSTDLYVEPALAYADSQQYAADSLTAYAILSQGWREAEDSGDWSGDLGTRAAWQTYHLRSEQGRWDGEQWVQDTVSSPCIDMGDPESDWSAEPEPSGERANIGAFGGTEQASMTPAG